VLGIRDMGSFASRRMTERSNSNCCLCFLAVFRLEGLPVALAAKEAFIDTMEALGHLWSNQGIVLDVEEVIDDEPDGLIGGHPVLAIEARKVDRNGVTAQSALATEIEIEVEIGEGEFAQVTMNWLTPAAAAVV